MYRFKVITAQMIGGSKVDTGSFELDLPRGTTYAEARIHVQRGGQAGGNFRIEFVGKVTLGGGKP